MEAAQRNPTHTSREALVFVINSFDLRYTLRDHILTLFILVFSPTIPRSYTLHDPKVNFSEEHKTESIICKAFVYTESIEIMYKQKFIFKEGVPIRLFFGPQPIGLKLRKIVPLNVTHKPLKQFFNWAFHLGEKTAFTYTLFLSKLGDWGGFVTGSIWSKSHVKCYYKNRVFS